MKRFIFCIILLLLCATPIFANNIVLIKICYDFYSKANM